MMRRKDTSLLVESWRSFINEGEGSESFAACYCRYWKDGGQSGFGGIGSYVKEKFTSSNSKSYFEKHLKEDNFHHLLYYLSCVPSIVDKKREREGEKPVSREMKEDWQEFCTGKYRSEGELDISKDDNVPSIIYVNYEYNDKVESGEKLNKLEDKEKITAYIKNLLIQAAKKGEQEKKNSPFLSVKN